MQLSCLQFGSSFSNGHNLASDNSCPFTGSDFVNIDPLLGPLQDNGGATLTHALLPGSPAIDTASNSDCPLIDQRGQSRPVDGNDNGINDCDIGAYEGHLLQVVKSANIEAARVGQIITYTYRIENLSNNTLVDLIAHDDHLGSINLPVTVLASNERTTGTLTYTINAGDLPGPLVNTVTVTGMTQPTGTLVTMSDDLSVELIFNPSIVISKKTNVSTAKVGDIITYTYRVTNTGDTGLTNFIVRDDLLGPVPFGITSLLPNQTATGTLTHTITEADPNLIINVAVVTGTLPTGSKIITVAKASITKISSPIPKKEVYLPLLVKRN